MLLGCFWVLLGASGERERERERRERERERQREREREGERTERGSRFPFYIYKLPINRPTAAASSLREFVLCRTDVSCRPARVGGR